MNNVELSVLDVQLHGLSIGTITHTRGDTTLFEFNRGYVENPARETLGLSFKASTGELRTEFQRYSTRLMPFFSNMLPEGPLREYLAEKGGVHPQREFFLLWLLGEDLPGAVRVVAPDSAALPPGYAQDADAEADGSSQRGLRQTAFRFSLAGVQLKFSGIAKSTGGLTIPAKGVGGAWIIKLPSDKFGAVPENEYAMMSLAKLVGITVPRIRLVPLGDIENLPAGTTDGLKGRTALAVERFDRRPDGAAVHVEDFAQIFNIYPQDKYKKASYMNIAQVLWAEARNEDVAEFVRRLVFNALVGKADMHVKNWSLIYPDRRQARLAPAYDFLNTTMYIADENAGLKFSRTRRYEELTLDELAHLARRAAIPENLVLEPARQTVDLFHQVWNREKVNLPIESRLVTAVEDQLAKIPLARPAGS